MKTTETAIITYQRPEMFARLVQSIRSYTTDRIVAYFDGCTYEPIPIELVQGLATMKIYAHHGKKNWWQLVDAAFKDSWRNKEWDYFYFLHDDLVLADDFYERSQEVFESLPDCVCLNLLADGRAGKSQWIDFEVEDCGLAWKSGWVDMIFMANREFFDRLEYRIDPILEERPAGVSTGVGRQITQRLKGEGLYQVKETLVHHGDHPSKLHPTLTRKDRVVYD